MPLYLSGLAPNRTLLMLKFYRFLTDIGRPALVSLLTRRANKGKELPERLEERKGVPGRERPETALVWVHAASVGEAQSALILINELLKYNDKLHILVTTGTVTSAELMEKKLPERAFHQFYPLDNVEWVESFLNHWRPDLILWMESELWPNMLQAIKERNIPAALINAKLSDTSYRNWRFVKGAARTLLSSFSLILTQTEKDAGRFRALGAHNAISTDNLKYSARALPASDEALKSLTGSIGNRPTWLYASTHDGEEALACRIHQTLKNEFPELLTIIIPRHPERGEAVKNEIESYNLSVVLRGDTKRLPEYETDIYVADTLGELGLFYRAAPIACIGRSFSNDGGGGHNPIEAAQLNCAILHGSNVQNLQQIYDEIEDAEAAIQVNSEQELAAMIADFLSDERKLQKYQESGLKFAREKEAVIERVWEALLPLLEGSGIIEPHKLVNRI